jgi:hypothetical protein
MQTSFWKKNREVRQHYPGLTGCEIIRSSKLNLKFNPNYQNYEIKIKVRKSVLACFVQVFTYYEVIDYYPDHGPYPGKR